MNLTAYSDSESDSEAPAVPKTQQKPAPKPSFQKVVDRSNAGRIKLNLPGTSQPAEKDDIQDEAPPAKKPRIGGGGAFGGFNAMLPAPKRANATAVAASDNVTSGKRGLGKGLAAGVNLKTGAEPAFQRESRPRSDDNANAESKAAMKMEDFRSMLNLSKSQMDNKPKASPEDSQQTSSNIPEPVTKPAAARFVPMSVGKGKKKKAVPRSAMPSGDMDKLDAPKETAPQKPAPGTIPSRKPKVSLFGTAHVEEKAASGPQEGQYQPFLHDDGNEDQTFNARDAYIDHQPPLPAFASASSGGPAPNELTNIAQELNLSEAERRQLFGKKGRDGQAAKIMEFNTDAEYAHNEHLRQQGEQVQHNALKSITGTGKNSLRSLVNVAVTQKDALEDHFAAGHRNKKEAGNRYGW